jgi:threonine dehydratase
MTMVTRPELSDPLTLGEIAAARRRIAGVAVRTPLMPVSDGRTWLKLECLQPTGSYKIRGATNALGPRSRAAHRPGDRQRQRRQFRPGDRRRGKPVPDPAIIHVPDKAARVKVENLRRMGATVHEHSFDDWWRIMETRETGDAAQGAVFFTRSASAR